MTPTNTSNREILDDIRNRVNASTDQQLAEAMQKEWEEGEMLEQNIPEEDIERIRIDIHRKIGRRKSRTRTFMRWTQAAAAILFIVCVTGAAYLYKKEVQYASMPEMKVSTGPEEQVTVMLPDGTKASLNYMSELSYAPQDFNGSTREVRFNGEGYYKVAKDPKHPFIIHGPGFKIEVLGTEFNIRNNGVKADITEVALVKGSVMLTATASGNTCKMRPNDIATIDKRTGQISVRQSKWTEDAAAWVQKQIVFRDVPTGKVIEELKRTYRTEIRMATTAKGNFTGTLPTNNLEEALKILSLTYNLKVVKSNDASYTLR